MLNPTNFNTKYSGNLGYYEKTKPSNNRNRRRCIPAERQRKYIQQNHTIETEGTLPNSFYEAAVTLILKPYKDATKKEDYIQMNLPHEH